MSEIRTLKDGDIQVLPRTVSDAVSMKNGNSVEVEINNKADRQLSNLSNYQKALHNIGGRPNRNLFRGWYFVGGGSQLGYGIFPINQRGNTQYTGAIYGIDGWKGVYGSEKVTIKSDCVSFEFSGNQGVRQELDKDILNAISGNICTVSIIWRLVSGNYANFGISVNGESKLVPPISVSENFVLTSITFDLSGVSASSGYGVISGDGVIEAIACKLEISSIQTLAYKDSNDNIKMFETPDYAKELARCQRYYRKLKNIQAVLGQLQNTSYYTNSIVIPDMRITPSIALYPMSDDVSRIAIVQGVMEFSSGIGVTLTSPYAVSFVIPKDNAAEGVAGKVLTVYNMVLNAEL